jgi:hypothetical protein
MPPPSPPRVDLRGRPLDSKGRPMDSKGRSLDGMDRPIDSRISDAISRVALPDFPNVSVAYPSFDDWVAIYDPRGMRPHQANQTSFLDFRQRHENQMLGAFREILTRASGKALLEETRGGRRIDVLPMDFVDTAEEWIKYHDNAIASSNNKHSSVIGMYAGTDEDGDNVVGSGRGAKVQIFYSPERLKTKTAGFLPDEVLYHEMVHAVRALKGLQTLGFSMKTKNGYDNMEEFVAVVVTNVYMSEKKQTQLRSGHGRGVLTEPEKFLDSPLVPAPGARGLLNIFRSKQRGFFDALAKIDANSAKFNPFRQFAEETVRAHSAHEAKMRAFDRK